MYRILFAAAFALSTVASPATAHPGARFVEFSVIDATGRSFKTYPAVSEASDVVRTYLQAESGARFRLRVHNPHGERIGVLIAVDGRNIISGQRSELAAGESMYIIDAYRTQVFSGWRTDADHVQAFYFTDAVDSYAGAWGDYSAMGTIAVAVFREHRTAPDHTHEEAAPKRKAPHSETPGAAPKRKAPRLETPGAAHGERQSRSMDESQAGTGFGERRWAQSRRVHFVASDGPVFRHIVKYEWRNALCRRGVISGCGEDNRLWPDIGYAPYPPGHRGPRW